MKCPHCDGSKLIHIAAVPGVHQRYDVDCPMCDGTGELPDPTEFPNACPACGEPIRVDRKWCEYHQAAEQLTDRRD